MRLPHLLSILATMLLVTLSLGSAHSQGLVESEPNDRFGAADAYTLGSELEGTLETGGDVDWFTFQVGYQGELRMSVTNVAAEMAVRMRVWNANRDVLSSWYNPLSSGGDTEGIFDLPAGGRYYLEVSDANGEGSEQPYTLRADFTQSPDQHEPNGRFGAAAEVSLGLPIAGTILPAGDVDWYAFDAEEHGELTVSILGVAADVGVRARVWNSNRDVLSSWFNPLAAGADTVGVFDLPAPGRYYLEVSAIDGDQRSVEAHTLQLDLRQSPDANEPNGRFGLAAEIGLAQAVPATILPAGDADWYAFEAEKHGELTIAIREVAEGLGVRARVWNSNRDVLSSWFNPLAAGGDTVGIFDIPAPGTYYLEVSAVDGSQRSVEPFSLRLDFQPAADDFEQNDSFGTATPFSMNRSAELNILPAGDHDWFSFEATSQGQWILEALDVPEDLGVQLRVWNSNRDVLSSWYSPLAVGGETQALFDVPGPGRYIVELGATAGSQRSIEHFIFKNSFTPVADVSEPNDTFETAAPIDLDETVPGNILPAGDSDWCVFEVTESGELHIAVLNASPELTIRFRLWNDQEQVLTSWFSALATGGNVEATTEIAEPGTYYLEISDNSGSARDIEPYYLRLSMEPIDIESITPPEPESSDDGAASETEDDGKVLIQTSGTVGAAGATLIVDGTDDYEVDGARLEIPADVLEEPTTISLGTSEQTPADVPFGLFPAGHFWQMTPAGLTFSGPVSITLPLPSGAEAGDEYFIAHWNGESWVDLGGEIQNGVIHAVTESFSTFGVFCGSFDQYSGVEIVNQSSAEMIQFEYLAGPGPIAGDAGTEYVTNCRPAVGDGRFTLGQGEAVPLFLRAGAYQFSFNYGDDESLSDLSIILPSGSDDQVIEIGDDGAESSGSAVVDFAGQAPAPNQRPLIACTVEVPAGVNIASIEPGVELPSRFVYIGPLREDSLPPTNLEFTLSARVEDPEGGVIRPYWTFREPGTLPVVGQPVASGSTLGDEINFRPQQAGVYHIYLTVYDEAEAFSECRWTIEVVPNSKPDVQVFTGRTHVEFGRLDANRANAGPIPFVATPGLPAQLPLASMEEGAVPVLVSSNTLCPSAILGPFDAFPDSGAVVPAPAPVDIQLPGAGADVTPRWPYPGRTCVWATPVDANLDPLFVRWEFPRPYFGAGTFYAAMSVPPGFHPDAAEGLFIGQLLRTAQQLNAYNAFVSSLYNTYGLVPAILWEAWDDPCLDGSGVPQNPCNSGLSEGGVTNLVALVSDGFDKEQLGFAPISVGPEGYEPGCDHVFFMTLTPVPSNPAPSQGVIVTARLSPITEACPVYFTIVGTDGFSNEAVIYTNKDGEARFAIPGAVEGTFDVVTAAVVKEDDQGVVDTGVEIIEMEVSYEF